MYKRQNHDCHARNRRIPYSSGTPEVCVTAATSPSTMVWSPTARVPATRHSAIANASLTSQGRPAQPKGCQTTWANRSVSAVANTSATCRPCADSRFTAKPPRRRSAASVPLALCRHTSRVGGARVTLASEVQVSPRGVRSTSSVVTTATPVGKALISRR